MFIDLNFNETYNIKEEVEIPKSYYENSEVINLSKIKLDGKLYYDNEDNLCIDIKFNGTMTLKDSVSYEDVLYPFSVEYNDLVPENLKKIDEKLDLFEFLWENIVLEVPLRFTKVEDYSEFNGNGWKLISEEEKVNNNPFGDLLKDFDKKE